MQVDATDWGGAVNSPDLAAKPDPRDEEAISVALDRLALVLTAEELKERELSQNRVADLLGISRSQLSVLINRHREGGLVALMPRLPRGNRSLRA
jgi:predicted XRE-type DNA-binding protein